MVRLPTSAEFELSSCGELYRSKRSVICLDMLIKQVMTIKSRCYYILDLVQPDSRVAYIDHTYNTVDRSSDDITYLYNFSPSSQSS